jgi:hypothetical protein
MTHPASPMRALAAMAAAASAGVSKRHGARKPLDRV